jgi:ABC-type methionine transport system ATPase subunit
MPKRFSCSNSGDSDIIAHSYIEISIDPHLLNNFANEDGMSAFLTAYSCSEEFQKLRNKLLEEVLNVIEKGLTVKQREVIKMTFIDGKTQNEISSELGKHQTTVHKILQGNIDYNNEKKRYGGALKKIRRLCSTNKIIQDLLIKMKDQCTIEANKQ